MNHTFADLAVKKPLYIPCVVPCRFATSLCHDIKADELVIYSRLSLRQSTCLDTKCASADLLMSATRLEVACNQFLITCKRLMCDDDVTVIALTSIQTTSYVGGIITVFDVTTFTLA
eukprot:4666885-Pleurochrysis_carterae.AAC.3